MSVVGVKIDQFDDPICNSFQATIVNDQLCYEVDLNRFSNKSNIAKELESGFYFLMDYNEDRQVIIQSSSDRKVKRPGMGANILESDRIQHAFISLDTIGKEQPTYQLIQAESFSLLEIFITIIYSCICRAS